MWDMYLLNQDRDLVQIVPQSLKRLYPDKDLSGYSTNDRISLYFNGLNANAFFYFQSFISKVKSHGK